MAYFPLLCIQSKNPILPGPIPPPVKQIENLIETYSMKKYSVACYDIESKIFNSRQGTLPITKYYRTLNGLWIELDQY
ncbi:hypothetical protein CR513_19779, partial [Mucuna pruriens]